MCKKTITSEYVSWGHPDKIADQISDAILDAFYTKDKNCRTGIEVMVKDNVVVLGGEVNSSVTINYDQIVREVFKNLPFSKEHHISTDEIKIINLIGKQSPEIHNGVDKENDVIGAGDQGFMVGFASNETDVYMPLGHHIAKTICMYITNLTPIYGPDVKTQVTVEYDDNNSPVITHILVSTMHQNNIVFCRKDINSIITNNKMGLSQEIYDKYLSNHNYEISVNPCGEWRIGGPVSDCGVTGRKIVVDAYGGYCNVGGGSFSGKCQTKVDRSAAYMARYLAKNIVASGICNTAKVTLAYMIGVPEPTSIDIELDINNDKVVKIKEFIQSQIDLTPKGIIDRFDKPYNYYPRYYNTARNGHYGYLVDNIHTEQLYPWEKIDFGFDLSSFLLTN